MGRRRPGAGGPDLAGSVLSLLDDLGLDRSVVVGLSMGGLVAMELALQYPERVSGVVLTATTAAVVTPDEAVRRRADADAVAAGGMFEHVLAMAPRLFGPAARRRPDLLTGVLGMMLRTPPDGAAASLRGRAERPDYAALLHDLVVPSLVVAGDQDGYSTAEVTAELVATLPDPEVVVLAGVGHLPNLEAPELIDDAVSRFVNRVTR